MLKFETRKRVQVYQQRLSRLWPLLEYILEQENQREDQEQQDNDECGDSNAVGFVEFSHLEEKQKAIVL
jgi:hypothetical protein